MDNMLLYNKIASLPEHLKSEVEDFIDFVSAKAHAKAQKAVAIPKFGSARGWIIIHPDFDEHKDDSKE
jgi:hypothetical protein